jgi:hypothetical protein
MSVTLNASTSSGLVSTADTSGTIELQSNGTTRLTVASGGITTTGTSSISNLTATGTFGGGVITSGTAVTLTTQTSVDYTSIPSWVKRITVMFNGVSGSGTANLLLQLGTSGGIVSTGYVSSGFRINAGTTSGGVSSTAGMILGSDNASWTTSGIATFALVGSNIWIGSFSGKGTTTSGLVSGMDVSLGGTLDRVRLTTSNGTDTLDAGSINILYEG